jgi:outer membrane murein-binding lipoprotein Lpp
VVCCVFSAAASRFVSDCFAAEKTQQTTLDQVKTLNADKQTLANRLAAAEKTPVSQRLLIGVKGFNLVEGGLLRLFCRGEPVCQRLPTLDQVKTLNADKQTLANRLAAAEKTQQTALDQVKALTWSRVVCCVFSAAASRFVSDCLSALRVLTWSRVQTTLDQVKTLNADKQTLANRLAAAEKTQQTALERFLRCGEPVSQRLLIGVKGFDLIKSGLLRLLCRGEPVSQRR